tara:strand:- start:501 stop:686 length:186 start_codon:yes stop_codon:yes gene_type:complete
VLEDNLWKEVHKSIDISEKIKSDNFMTAKGMEALTVLSLMEIASELKEIRSILGGNNETKS